MRFACVGVTLAGLVGVGSASGAYMVAATSNGMSSRTVQPGNSFQLDIELSSDASDQINSAILRLVFSDAGLQYNAYDWSDPFEDGSITDDSTPGTPELPALIDADSLAGVGYPAGVVDVELSNVILTSSRFGSGVLISLTLVVALRSFKLGLVSMVPNLAPAVVTFGTWSLFVGEVGLASSVVTATSLGLIVDATVHFLSKYIRARREHGDSPEDAVRYAFHTVGTALWVTTAIVVLGFSVLALSDFTVNASMGLMTAFAVASALIIDFVMLPPLLLAVDRRRDFVRPRPDTEKGDAHAPA